MTTAHAEPSAGDHAHDDHAHAFDGEPATTLPADEPRTPAWVPMLGIVLFLGFGVAHLLHSDDTAAEGGGAAPAKAAEAPAPPVEVQLPRPPAPEPPAVVRPAATDLPRQPDAKAGAAAAAKLKPEQLKQIQMLLDQEHAKHSADLKKAPAPAKR